MDKGRKRKRKKEGKGEFWTRKEAKELEEVMSIQKGEKKRERCSVVDEGEEESGDEKRRDRKKEKGGEKVEKMKERIEKIKKRRDEKGSKEG